MKTKILFLLLSLGFIVSTASAQVAGCTVRGLGKDQYKSNSPVRRSSALSSPIVRFALNPTIIFVATNPARLSRATAYDVNGGVLFTAPRLTCASKPRGECLSRYKASETGASNTRNARRTAVRRTGNPGIIWKVSSTTCVRVADIGKCYNVKVRELCDGRTIS